MIDRKHTKHAMHRSMFVAAVLVLMAGIGHAQSKAEPWKTYHEAFTEVFKSYNAAQLGTVKMEGPAEIRRGAYGVWKFVYTAGSDGLTPGGSIRLTFRHLSGWGIPQNLDPGGPNFTTASAPEDVPIQVTPMQHFQIWNRYFLAFFPWQHVTEVKVEKGLKPGQTITLTLGDRSLGSPGERAPAVARDRAWFLMWVDATGGGRFTAIDKDLYVRVLPGPAVRLRIVLPSQAAVGVPVDVQLRAEDSDGNMATDYRGTVHLRSHNAANLPAAYTFTEADQGVHWFHGVVFSQTGIQRVLGDAGNMHAESNPILVSARPPAESIYWGELHGHSIFSDGTGMPQQYFDYARHVAALDFAALTDHIEMLNPVREKMISELTDQYNDSGHFVTIHAYEWSGVTESGGHHNVYMLRAGVPSFRSSNSQNSENPFLYYGPPEFGADHVERLYEKLREQPGAAKGEIIVIPHWRGATATPEWSDPLLQRLVELTSEAGYHEGWAQTFQVPGTQIGFIGAGDDHYGRPGYGMDDRFDHPWNYTRQGSPLTAVIAPEKTREAIFSNLYQRHTYATTGARIILRVSADGHQAGDSYVATGDPVFHVLVAGTAPLRSVEIKRLYARAFEVTDPMPDMREHAEIVFQQSLQPGQEDTEFTCNITARPGPPGFYYVHVVQTDGEQADSSPIRIRWK